MVQQQQLSFKSQVEIGSENGDHFSVTKHDYKEYSYDKMLA